MEIYIYRYFDVRFGRKVVKMNRVDTILLVKILRDVELELIFFLFLFFFSRRNHYRVVRDTRLVSMIEKKIIASRVLAMIFREVVIYFLYTRISFFFHASSTNMRILFPSKKYE